jgi:hypothetical protein
MTNAPAKRKMMAARGGKRGVHEDMRGKVEGIRDRFRLPVMKMETTANSGTTPKVPGEVCLMGRGRADACSTDSQMPMRQATRERAMGRAREGNY